MMTSTGQFELLDWDSQFFGMIIAKIYPNKLKMEELKHILSILRNKSVELVYWATDPLDDETQIAAKLFDGILVDCKMTYEAVLTNDNEELSEACWLGVEQFKGKTPNHVMENLAIEAGKFSRFKKDSSFPYEKFERLYRHWICESINNNLADVVFISRSKSHDSIEGMITVRIMDNQGEIGLVAVNKNVRGQKIGSKMIRAAKHWVKHKGCDKIKVVTQQANTSGRALYEKNGFQVKKIENFYHFWL
jgi:dTDP-4-amino-4,6-dideoxy-D-galactose acyltransferase